MSKIVIGIFEKGCNVDAVTSIIQEQAEKTDYSVVFDDAEPKTFRIINATCSYSCEFVSFLNDLIFKLSNNDCFCDLYIGDDEIELSTFEFKKTAPKGLDKHLTADNYDSDYHFAFVNDWRLNDQMDYLYREELKRSTFKETPQNDHDHCCFFWETFSECYEDSHEGYCTLDEYLWVCDKCYEDFHDMFEWRVKNIDDIKSDKPEDNF